MLLTAVQLNATYCTYFKKNKTYSCKFPGEAIVDAVLYEGFFGLVLTLVFLVLHSFYYYLNRFVEKDFTKCFTTATLFPLTIGVVLRFFEILFTIIFSKTYYIVDVCSHLYTVCLTTAFVTVHIGVAVYIYSHAFVVCTRRAPTMEDSWTIYLSIQLIGWLVAGCFHFTATDYKKLPAFALVGVMIGGSVLFVIAQIALFIASFFCFSIPAQTEDPVVKKACVRMFFSMSTYFWLIPSYFALVWYYDDLTNLVAMKGVNMKTAANLFYKQRILEFFICFIFLLPTYRDAIATAFCGSAYKYKHPDWAKKLKNSNQNITRTPLLTGRAQVHPLTFNTAQPQRIPLRSQAFEMLPQRPIPRPGQPMPMMPMQGTSWQAIPPMPMQGQPTTNQNSMPMMTMQGVPSPRQGIPVPMPMQGQPLPNALPMSTMSMQPPMQQGILVQAVPNPTITPRQDVPLPQQPMAQNHDLQPDQANQPIYPSIASQQQTEQLFQPVHQIQPVAIVQPQPSQVQAVSPRDQPSQQVQSVANVIPLRPVSGLDRRAKEEATEPEIITRSPTYTPVKNMAPMSQPPSGEMSWASPVEEAPRASPQPAPNVQQPQSTQQMNRPQPIIMQQQIQLIQQTSPRTHPHEFPPMSQMPQIYGADQTGNDRTF